MSLVNRGSSLKAPKLKNRVPVMLVSSSPILGEVEVVVGVVCEEDAVQGPLPVGQERSHRDILYRQQHRLILLLAHSGHRHHQGRHRIAVGDDVERGDVGDLRHPVVLLHQTGHGDLVTQRRRGGEVVDEDRVPGAVGLVHDEAVVVDRRDDTTGGDRLPHKRRVAGRVGGVLDIVDRGLGEGECG